MGYFSNGSEGLDYEARYCSRCVHESEDKETCPVLTLHMIWNYDACGDSPEAKAKKKALDTLIPREGIGNGQCSMFMAARDVEA